MPNKNHFDSNLTEFTVSQISSTLKRTIENAFERVRVRGEISGLKRASSGHIYLTLKDEKAVLDGVIWRGTASTLRVIPEDGLETIVEGRLTTYPGRSKYQIVIDRLEPAGIGALLALLEERRKKLSKEGLFDKNRKKPIPYLPSSIGVVSSPTGAVFRDILHRLRDRFPRPVILWPVLVQGKGSAEEIASAVEGFNKLKSQNFPPRPDLLIIARGGGSVEDLWAFNEEVVVRAVAESSIPVISAVGHETDNTLIDLVADQRAPTPTAAAEMAVPVRADLMVTITELDRLILAGTRRALIERKQKVTTLALGLPRPEILIGDSIQRLDERNDSIHRVFSAYFDRRKAALEESSLKLIHPRERLLRAQTHLSFTTKQLDNATYSIIKECFYKWLLYTEDDRVEIAIKRILSERLKQINMAAMLLESYSYQRVIERGFTVIRDQDEQLITRSSQATENTNVIVEFADDKRAAILGKIKRNRKKQKDPKNTDKKKRPIQESLL